MSSANNSTTRLSWQEFESWEAASDEDFEKLELAEDDYLEGPPAPWRSIFVAPGVSPGFTSYK